MRPVRVVSMALNVPGSADVAALRDDLIAGNARHDGRESVLGAPARPRAISSRYWRRMTRLSRLAATCALQVLDDGPSLDTATLGVVWGTSMGELDSTTNFLARLFEEGVGRSSPTAFQNSVYNTFPGHLSMALGLSGPSETLSAGAATGAAALMRGLDLVAMGELPACLVVCGSELSDLRRRAAAFEGPDSVPLGEGVAAILLAPGSGISLDVAHGVAPASGPVWQRTSPYYGEQPLRVEPEAVSADAVLGQFDTLGLVLAVVAAQCGGWVLDQDMGREWTIRRLGD
jgi:hypothetical protein